MDITQLNAYLGLLANGLLVLAIPIVIAFLFQWLRLRAHELRAHLGVQQQQFIDNALGYAVRAAEQAGLAGQLSGGGAGKKAYAIRAAQDYLRRLGVQLDVSALATLVEAEVNKQFSNAAPVVDDAATRSALLDKAVKTAVMAAEQSGLNKTIQNVAGQKKQYALDFAFKYLSEHGLRVDPTVVNGLLEATIHQMKTEAPALTSAAITALAGAPPAPPKPPTK
jgi:hypothetical protein